VMNESGATVAKHYLWSAAWSPQPQCWRPQSVSAG